jgi:hypothetical protein
MDNYSNYPLGAEHDHNAPWNQKDFEEKDIEVTISVTLSKTVTISVNDYKIEESGLDEEGYYFEDIDFSECNLEEAVKEQITLPQDLDKSWNVDEFIVIKE